MNERYGSMLQFKENTKEELLPDFENDFLYTASRSHITKNTSHAPWHWHKAVELFYVESGAIEYNTPLGKVVLSEGCGGLVNSGVLHMTQLPEKQSRCVLLLHLFDTTLITGHSGSRIDQKYIAPITDFSNLEILPLYKDDPRQASILEKLKSSFLLSEKELGYEIRLRSILSDILVDLMMITASHKDESETVKPLLNDKMKLMMTYVHENYSRKINIKDIADAAFVSERECYRSFHMVMHTTPNQYIQQYRIQIAARLLRDTADPITTIAQNCGFGTSSFFAKVFREYYQTTPLQYRNKRKEIPSD